jgi:hypothetical protein
MAEQGSFWETLIGGTGEGPEEERKEKVRRNCSQLEIEEILVDPELVHAARGHMEETFQSGELDPGGR